ncbi:hypothetical protein Snoj_28290 [Streptomyces nojiriensis]|uniref:Uncharacterized protein n=1 Tax=Streptomyces nojiriensis TaxID=66374 RepID=A0ABQ3SLA4_9ACTN|nr:hypothetical protein [Streptomyces nojiriensis]QTI42508.1 hypothetical protein JYK04_00266 [Streptomyces nojiriensis]GGS40561.1 hypothetical protein GCM10010205_82350 [Streptomyces nojiriensis]GHI68911.1 hypothetical protein Snoj_28290 [Streptomyces nojiriensis]
MSESTPNSKGPAKVQMSPESTQAEPALVPVSEVDPEDVGTLALEYRDGRPVIIVSGGEFVPAGLKVVSEDGEVVGVYRRFTAGSGTQDNAVLTALMALNVVIR